MWTWVLFTFLSQTPRTLPQANATLHMPSLQGAQTFTEFLRNAGRHAVVLRTENWRSEMHPLLNVDLTRPDEVEAEGIDAAGPFTFSTLPGARMSCVRVKAPSDYVERIKARLSARGTLWTGREAGVSLLGATLDKRWLYGVALRKNETCTVRFSNGRGEELLREVARMLRKTPSAPNGPQTNRGVVLKGPFGTWAFDGDSQKAVASTQKVRALNFEPLKPGPSPYARLENRALGVIRARVQVSQHLSNFLQQLQTACPAMGDGASWLKGLSAHLTGNVAIVLNRFEAEGSLRKPAGRYFSMKHVVLAEVKKPKPQALPLAPSRHQFNCETGQITVGLEGNHLYVGNDADVVDSALAQLGQAAGTMKHSIEFEAHLPLVAKALSKVSFFDVVGQPEWTGLFAVGTELGPLMTKSQKLTGWVNKNRAEAEWRL